MSDPRAASGGARWQHPGHGGRRPQCQGGRRGHPGVRARQGDAGALPGRLRARDDQIGAVPCGVRRSLFAGVQVSVLLSWLEFAYLQDFIFLFLSLILFTYHNSLSLTALL